MKNHHALPLDTCYNGLFQGCGVERVKHLLHQEQELHLEQLLCGVERVERLLCGVLV